MLGHVPRTALRSMLAAGAASALLNVLALTGSVYALLLYNSVLPDQSVDSLAALTLAMLGLYGVSAWVDVVRVRLMGKAARCVDEALSGRVFAGQLRLALRAAPAGDGLQPMRDLDQIRSFLASAAPTALFDLPFLPLFVAAIFVLHPLLGTLALAGAFVLLALMLAAEPRSSERDADAAARRWAFIASALRSAEAVHGMGMGVGVDAHWRKLNAAHRERQERAAQRAQAASAVIKAARPALQSAMLGLGAYLAITGQGSAGGMLAASILLSRALAPMETVIAHWRSIAAARHVAKRLCALLSLVPPRAGARAAPARPRGGLRVAGLMAAAPGAQRATLRDITFEIEAGGVLGVAGANGAGKSTLARVLVGAWTPLAGTVRLDGLALSAWDADPRGPAVGYLPQDAQLICGTVAQNIARFAPDARHEDIAAAARAAGADAMIEQLPRGYDTEVGTSAVLSAGQRQRIALARALYLEPFLVVLDEPDAGLDGDGLACLKAAIRGTRGRGGIVVVMAHSDGVLATADRILRLAGGRAGGAPVDSICENAELEPA